MIVFRPFITELRKLWHHWAAQPFWAAGLLCLLAALVVSGPLACFAHCAVMGETHHGHHTHHGLHGQDAHEASVTAGDHQLLVVNERGDHALCNYLMGQSSDLLPSALTVAVVSALNLVPQIFAIVLQRLDLTLLLRHVALPPPREPPRISNSFTI
jgi:hypothetical protein